MTELIKNKKYFTEGELAKRWRFTESTIKNLRDRGQLPYFRLPGSSRILYPVEAIEELEKRNTIPVKEVDKKRQQTETKRNKPDVSATKKKEWRI